MTQATNFGVPRNGPKSPTDMFTQLDENLDAALTNHSGSSRPSYAQAGTIWADTSISNTTIMKLYDGEDDHEIYRVDNTGKFTFPAISFNGNEITGLGGLNGGKIYRKDWVTNGDFSVNQRNAASKAQSVGIYGFDRWRGHANGIEQIVEALPADEYTLCWEGGGSATFGGVTATEPIKAMVVAGDTSIVVPADASNVSLLQGDATYETNPFIHRDVGENLLACMRYYHKSDGSPLVVVQSAPHNNPSWIFPVPMRRVPDFSATIGGGSGATFGVTKTGFYQSNSNSVGAVFSYIADAEF